MKRWIAIVGMAVAAAIVLVVVGVGGSGGRTVPSSMLTQAAAATSATRGYRIAVTASMTVSGHQGPIPMKGTGAIDPVHGRGSQTLEVSGLPTGTMRMQQVFQGLVMYMRSPALKAAAGGKSWVKLDVRKLQLQMGVTMPQGGLSGDPAQMLDQLRAVSGDVEELGREAVRGTPTRHYRAEIDLRRYPNLAPPSRRAEARAGVERLIDLIGTSKIPNEVWIDSQHHVRRFKFDYTAHMATLPGKPTMEMKMSEDLFDFGTPVRVKIPSADDVTDLSALAGRGLPRPQ
jgi:hypothetical protein